MQLDDEELATLVAKELAEFRALLVEVTEEAAEEFRRTAEDCALDPRPDPSGALD